MRIFTHISLLTTLLAILASSVVAALAIFFCRADIVLVLCIIPIGFLIYFLSFIIAHCISEPLKELVLKMKAYRDGDRSVSFTPSGKIREIDELSGAIQESIVISETRLNELTALKQRQDVFISDVAHEFRTPLTAISGNAELMLDPDMPAETRQHFCEIILTESERLKKLTNSLLALQHAKESTTPDAIERIDMKSLAQEAIDVLDPLAQDKAVTLSIEGEAPDILGTPDRIKQALINLIDNAIRHVDEGGHVRITLSGLNRQTIVAVRDDGCGFGDVDPILLFKRFYRTDSSRARHSGGAGLGLAIVKEIVEAHDGSVTAFNASEGGAVFVMAFPSI